MCKVTSVLITAKYILVSLHRSCTAETLNMLTKPLTLDYTLAKLTAERSSIVGALLDTPFSTLIRKS